jgi:hypothetical protein
MLDRSNGGAPVQVPQKWQSADLHDAPFTREISNCVSCDSRGRRLAEMIDVKCLEKSTCLTPLRDLVRSKGYCEVISLKKLAMDL